ncbi:ABC transporter permease subunit [Bacillus sp. S13(2024)]|uniref:ABC transporter permease n=1 Tax=unclassified Bacillus (in: firmicutes) TaxID=185979 RepID=UPI003D1B5C1A
MKRPFNHYVTIGIVFLYLFIPLLATILYSFATNWNRTILPEGLTLQWYSDLFSDMRFIEAFGRSLLLSLGSTVLAIVIMVPAIFSIVVYAPRLEKFVQALIIMTYAMPGVIIGVGLIRSYSSSGISMVLVVVGAYFVTILPYMYQGTRNSLRTIHAKSLMEAAEMLGASRFTAFMKIIVPNILSGLLVSSLLSFSMLFGEFVLINLLVGGRFETIQTYLYQNLSKSGHIASAIVVCYFFLMCILSIILVKMTRIKKEAV